LRRPKLSTRKFSAWKKKKNVGTGSAVPLQAPDEGSFEDGNEF